MSSPEAIRHLVRTNQRIIEEDQSEIDDLTKKIAKCKRDITELQRVCPHENTTEEDFMDGAEMKLHNVCQDCGAEVRGK